MIPQVDITVEVAFGTGSTGVVVTAVDTAAATAVVTATAATKFLCKASERESQKAKGIQFPFS